jgi:hypothetical protein
MDISRIPDRVWRDLLIKDTNHNFESLSLKIMLARLKTRLKLNPGEERNCIAELKEMISNHGNLPSLQHDLQKIMNGGVL